MFHTFSIQNRVLQILNLLIINTLIYLSDSDAHLISNGADQPEAFENKGVSAIPTQIKARRLLFRRILIICLFCRKLRSVRSVLDAV